VDCGLKKIQGIKSVIQRGNEYIIISQALEGNLNRVLVVAQMHGGVTNITADKPSLENVFLTLTGKKLRDEGAPL